MNTNPMGLAADPADEAALHDVLVNHPLYPGMIAGSWPDPNGGTWVEGEHFPF